MNRPLLAGRVGLFAALIAFAAASAGSAQTNANHPARLTPDWVRKSVVYEIFPRNFSAGGDFSSITARLDELQNLGVNILWLMPVQPTGEKLKKGSLGSPYAVRDYFAVNSAYGSTNDLKTLVAAAHQRQMKVILDVVAGHTAWDSVLMNQPEFYRRDESGKILAPNPDWTDVAALNYENQALRRYMIGMLKYWMQEFGFDGFRCDVSFRVPVDFWETARAELEQVNPQVLLLADANATPGLLVKAFDMDNSGAFYASVNRVMSGLSPAYLIQKSWESTRLQFPRGALHLRFTDDHELPRAVARYGLSGALAAQVLMMTLDGIPLLYNGMEVGDATESGGLALFEKLPIYWTPDGRPPLREIYRHLIRLRKAHPAFTNDDVVWLQNTTPAEVVTFTRRDEATEFLVCLNLSSVVVSGSVETAAGAEFTPLQIEGLPRLPRNTLPEYRLGGYEWRIYQRPVAEK
jgi:glycosidase